MNGGSTALDFTRLYDHVLLNAYFECLQSMKAKFLMACFQCEVDEVNVLLALAPELVPTSLHCVSQ